jgi:hypothetical protein
MALGGLAHCKRVAAFTVSGAEEILMDEERFNMAVRKFLREVGVTSQREIERVVRDVVIEGSSLRLRMTLTSENVPTWQHVVEAIIELR